MKRLFTTICLFTLLLCSKSGQATHSAGGELSYTLVPGTTNTYQFIFKFYRDCGSANIFTSTEPASFTLCYTSPCTGTIQTATMPKIVGNIGTTPPVPNGSPLNNGCNAITTCDNINSPIHGYRQWWYSTTITLPVTCNFWKFWTTLCCRNDITGNITTPPGSQYLYIEATFDNTVAQNNSSPVFISGNAKSKLPVPYVCINAPYSHDGGAMDPDGDVMKFTTILPRSMTGCTANTPATILLPAYNILNTNGDPFPTANTYNLDTTNGFFNFTATTLGYYVLCIKADEYRNGTWIGSTMRDMQIVVDNCTPLPIVSTLDSLSILNGNLNSDTVMTCPGSLLEFCFDITDSLNPAAHVFYDQSNFATAMPGSQITTSNPSINTLRICVSWPVTMADTGLHMLTVWVNDTIDCLTAPGSSNVPIYVRKPMYAGGDTSICYGDTTQLWVVGNGVYTWSVLPGGDNIGSLSCNNCSNPNAYPDKTTSYVVTDVLCGFQDTILIFVYDSTDPIPEFTITPSITTLANPDLELKNHSQHALYYRWYDSTHTYLGDMIDLSITATEVGTYCYTLEAENFCHEIRSVTHCAHVVGDGSLAFPTGFTPNGDGINDGFHPIIIGDMSFRNYEMVIYNRWGMQLFKSKNITEGWNGKFKGKECEADTYYYYVEAYHGVGDKLVYKGDVILIR